MLQMLILNMFWYLSAASAPREIIYVQNYLDVGLQNQALH